MSDPTSAEISDENLDTLIALNLVSNVLLTREFLPGMRAKRWGRMSKRAPSSASIVTTPMS
jgi:NAD(P)-dependent dehydrogenase (short-subunit alcohol dehydrogenase family)